MYFNASYSLSFPVGNVPSDAPNKPGNEGAYY